MFDPTLNFADLEWLRKQWDGTLLVKGIQTADDAAECTEPTASSCPTTADANSTEPPYRY